MGQGRADSRPLYICMSTLRVRVYVRGHSLWPTAGGETAVLRWQSSQLRPRPSGTRGQMHCWDLLRVLQRRRSAAARLQTGLVRFSAYTCTDKKTRTRKISWTGLPHVYHNAQVYLAYTTTRRQIYVSGSRRCSGSSRRLPTSSRILSLHTLPSRQLGKWEIPWIDYASRENHAQAISPVTDTKNIENGAPRAELTTFTTLFADRNQCLEVVLPNALHKQ